MMTQRWMDKSDILALFPTLVWKFHLTRQARDECNEEILATLVKLRPTSEDSSRAWQSAHNLHTVKALGGLVSCIEDSTHSILKFLKISHQEFQITGCWANVNPRGAIHGMHSHPNSFLSGVYYVQAPSGADTINFHDPRIQAGIIRPPVTELTSANTDQMVVNVQSGTLLFFPSYLQHSVAPNDSHHSRISLSFNIMFSSYAESIGKPMW